MKKGIAILGSTGSIGVQALEVISENNDLFDVEVLTANDNSQLLIKQAKLYNCLLYTSPSQRDKRQYRMPSSA